MGLEGFVDWTNPRVSESTKEEAEMSGLVSGFATMMRKRVASSQGLNAPLVLKYLAESV